MPSTPAKKPVRKRATRKQLDERLANVLGPKNAHEAAAEIDPDSLEARRQRIRDRAGDDPPQGMGRPRK